MICDNHQVKKIIDHFGYFFEKNNFKTSVWLLIISNFIAIAIEK